MPAMTARLACVCMDAVDPRPVTDFWAAVLGWDVVGPAPGDGT